MRTPTLYLDTSTIGGYFDDEWKDATQELWRQMEAGQWKFVTSTTAVAELEQAPERVRELFKTSFEPENVFDVTDEMDELAAAYVRMASCHPSIRTMPGTSPPAPSGASTSS